MNAQDHMVLAANKLARAAPTAWAEFLEAFDAYSQQVKDECVQAPIAILPVAQGRAQQCVRVSDLLRSCQAAAAKILNNQTK